ncbi:hypothetical protein PENARI_c001G12521 [Penicillium arizonense]|uniref:Uncharacterized protein n=1 Tax=Penicillium arizonense TaxID=1835702 RepID=A0A1F5LYT1_PENAI|nr:hypothetical protein PENARI_c001G12521 [Penicillium arizonense]OGE58278.1 hypothetical protein PENARI_c001G12521 [Penicillium arizonense]
MVDGPVIRGRLTRVSRSIRAVMRCLGGNRESQDGAQRAMLLLCELLDLLSRLQDQLNWVEDKWVVDPSRLRNLDEVLRSFESTIGSIEVYFQPGGITARSFRKRLLESTFIPRLEQFKVMMLLSMQPESREKAKVEDKLRNVLRRFHEMDHNAIRASTPDANEFHTTTSQIATKSFMRLADLCNKRLKGTCEWIFDNDTYTNWLFGCSRTLYCVGPAGAGKTFLASTIIDNLQKTFTSADVAVIFIFGHDEAEEETSSVGFLDKILAQLVYRKRVPSHTTACLYKSKSFAEGNVSAKTYQDAIRAEVNRFSRVMFVIDGIDMNVEKDRIINRLQKLPDHAQLLITSREAKYGSKDEHLSALATPGDLETYVCGRIHQDEGLTAMLDQYAPELKVAVIQQVARKSLGLFLLARLNMDLLSRCQDGNLLQRSLFHLPENLNDAYGESMTRIVSQNPFASRCLYWTLYAQRPLTVSELNFAASYEVNGNSASKEPSSTEHSMLYEAAGLLTIDAMSGTVHLVHKTAKEYLSGPAARVFFPTAKVNIADVCLTIITPDDVIDDCYVSKEAISRKPRGKLLNYATTYWGHHAREVGEDEQATQVLIRAFLNKLSWRRPPGTSSCALGLEMPKQLGLGKYFSDWASLHVLAYFGIIGKARRLIEQGADLNDCDNQLGVTALHCAVYRGNEEMVDLLLASKANINAISKDGKTVLHIAGEQGHRKLVKLLLHRGANSRTASKEGATALQLAVGTTHDEATVPLLIKSRFDMDVQNTVTGNTALHLAVELKRPRILAFLLEKGASMNILNRDGMTALQLACKTDNCEAASLLLERGTQLETRSSYGMTALHIAALENNWVAFDMLVIGGADINAWDSEGESLLHKQARDPSAISVAAHLLAQGANLEACNSQGYTPLQCAAVAGNKAMFLFLADQGARLDVQTAKGETLLHITPPLNQDCLDILESLFECNFSANATTCSGLTPLHHLVINDFNLSDHSTEHTASFISLLLSHGANINAPVASCNAETALHLAVIAKVPRESLVSLLIKSGASLDSRTSDGKTPLHLAAERGRHHIFQILLDAGADPSIQDFVETPTNDKLTDGGLTALDLARKNPISVLWFDDSGKLQSPPPPPTQQRRSLATTIDELDTESEIGEIGGSTLVGEDSSIWGSRASTTSVELPSIFSSC